MNMNLWIVDADISHMQTAMESGAVKSEQLVQAYIERIKSYNGTINAVLELNPEAMQIARDLDIEREDKGSRGKLHGIPILLKDNIDTHDRMHTSAGSIALENSIAVHDSFVAAQLRKAGAVLLGKTNMTEWSNFMHSQMPAGYSSRGGLVVNPYGPDELFVSGSSSGSAAAVAADMAAAAIGTETAGSIIGPASQHALVGVKPTVGLVSRSGIIPISVSQDTPGPIAKTVTDAAIILGALTGIDEWDAATSRSEGHFYNDYTSFLDEESLTKAKIGIPRHYYKHLDAERLAIMEDAIQTLKDAGVTIVDSVSSMWNIFRGIMMSFVMSSKRDLISICQDCIPPFLFIPWRN